MAELLDQALYTRLCRLAAASLKAERSQQYWEACDLVHEALLRIARTSTPVRFQSPNHLYALTSIIMRHILIDHARSSSLSTRYHRVPLDPEVPSNITFHFDGLVIHETLARLEEFESRWHRIVDMRFFTGLAVEEIASQLAISERTVKRDWSAARAWLRQQLSAKTPSRRSDAIPLSSASAEKPKAILPRRSDGVVRSHRRRTISRLPPPLEALRASA
jgi:RNA polymerase sigma factor (TIGR02999 family)